MKNIALKFVIFLGLVAIIGTLSIQFFWFNHTKELKDSEFQQKVQIALFKVAKDIALLNKEPLPTFNIISQKSYNFFEVNVNSSIQSDWLEYSLLNQLLNVGLQTDFEYAIFDCESKEMVYGNYCDLDTQIPKEKPDFQARSGTEYPYFFSIRFPNRSSFIRSTMDFSLLFMAFLFLVLLFFALTLFILIQQQQQTSNQRDWINNMTHEFKTPLSSLKIASSFFKKDKHIQQDVRLSKYTDIMNTQVTKLEKNIDILLQLAKVDNTNFNLSLERANINNLVTQVTEDFKTRLNPEEITVSLPPKDLFTQLDVFHFTNIISNLLENSIKYSSKETRIKVSLTEQGNMYLLRFKDAGDGIPAEALKTVFKKFTRVHSGDTHDTKGFGIGLFYVKKIVELHDWKLFIDSKPAVGTTVEIQIKK